MLKIRPVELGDLEALYAISLQTGHEGGDASQLYRDRKVIGHIYSAPYALLEPTFALVAEEEDRIAGFAVGTPDTEAWYRRLEVEWWPKLRKAYPDPDPALAAGWSPDERRAFMIHHPSPPPHLISKVYPAHVHLNIATRLQGQGIGTILFSEWLRRAASCGVSAVHVGINRANARAIRFWSRQDFGLLRNESATHENTVWMGRLWGT